MHSQHICQEQSTHDIAAGSLASSRKGAVDTVALFSPAFRPPSFYSAMTLSNADDGMSDMVTSRGRRDVSAG